MITLTTPREFIRAFRMDQENYEFNRQEFIKKLSETFLERIQKYPKYNTKTGTIYYSSFREIVKSMNALYWEISALSSKPLTQGLWNAFFVNTVVPYRKKHFPEIQAIIEGYKDKPKKTRQDKTAK